MAVNTRNDKDNGKEDIRVAGQRSASSEQTAAEGITQTRTNNNAGLRSVNRLLSRSVGRNAGSQQVLTLKKLMEDIIREKGIDENYFHLVSIDTTTYNVAYPTLAVVTTEEAGGKLVYNAFIFALCGGLAGLPKKEVQLPGESVYVPRTWVDNITRNYRSEVRNACNVFLDLDRTGGSVNVVGATVVPHELTLDSGHIALTCLAAAENACAARFTMDYGSQLNLPTFDIGWLSTADQPTSNVQFNASDIQDTDIVGNPVRSDISIILSNRIRNTATDYDQQQRLIGTTGYIDLTYSPQTLQQQQNFAVNPIAKTVCYQPRFIMTSMYPLDIEAFTPELLALGIISTVATLNTGNTWMADFITKARRKGGMHNPGALAIELDESIKDPIDLSANNDEEIYAFMRTAVHESLVYSMDVPEEGEYSWLFGLFAQAASIVDPENRDKVNKAYSQLYQAFDRALLGKFAPLFKVGTPMVFSSQNRIALGHYVGNDNRKHDIRDVDTLYMLGQNSNNLNAVIQWEDTFDQTDVDVNKRIVTRDEILSNMFGGAFTQTGWAQRYDFNPALLKALVEAAIACQFTIKPENIRAFAGISTRGNSAIQALGMSGVDTGIYASSGNGNQQASGVSSGNFDIFN